MSNNWCDESESFIEYDTYTLEKLQVAMTQYLSGDLLGARVSVKWDHVFDNVALKILGYVWAEQLQHWDIEYPCDWWQAFKERWFPKWAKRRCPVRYKRHHIDLKAIYPGLKHEVPDDQYRLQIFARDYI